MGIVQLVSFDASQLESQLLKDFKAVRKLSLKKAGDFGEFIFDEWMGTWNRKYKVSIDLSDDSAVITISNSGADATGTSPFDQRAPRDGVPGYLDEGTPVRFAVMTSVFSAKTAAGMLGSVPGQGGFLELRPDEPHAGIDKRDISGQAADELEKEIEEMIDLALGVIFG